MARHAYRPSDDLLDTPVTVEEVSGLRGQLKALGRDTESLDHLLVRVARTLIHLDRRLRAAARDVEALRSDAGGSGRATTLDPADAVRYLPPERLKELVGTMARSQLAVYTDLLHRVGAHQARLEAASVGAREALAGLAGLPMDDPTRAALQRAWDALALPAPPDDLPHPSLVDPDVPAPAMAGRHAGAGRHAMTGPQGQEGA